MTRSEIEEHDRGFGYDIAVMSRRRILLGLGAVAGLSAVTACDNGSRATQSTSSASATSASAPSTSTAAAAPQETLGPYPGDGSNGPNVLIESGVVRSDVTTSFGAYTGVAQGVPATLTINLQDLSAGGAPGAGMALYIWHCDREGKYSLYSDGVTEQNYLRGVQVADDAGTVTFRTIFPATYPGRWPHMHFEVFDSLETAVAGSEARLTSQIALAQEISSAVYAFDDGYAASIPNLADLTLDSDMVFGDGWTAQMASTSGTPDAGIDISITIGVADKSQNVDDNPLPPGPPPGGLGGPPPGGLGGPPPGGLGGPPPGGLGGPPPR
ncbi:dioxygenase [Mycolicibacterium sp. 22603]|uniref:dioxygenase family protein n=1 Tax=Mycolicibacterium sp. 22603 TaxID=3453950 RepID=UPI003F866A57